MRNLQSKLAKMPIKIRLRSMNRVLDLALRISAHSVGGEASMVAVALPMYLVSESWQYMILRWTKGRPEPALKTDGLSEVLGKESVICGVLQSSGGCRSN